MEPLLEQLELHMERREPKSLESWTTTVRVGLVYGPPDPVKSTEWTPRGQSWDLNQGSIFPLLSSLP